jgi:hypothetical protein
MERNATQLHPGRLWHGDEHLERHVGERIPDKLQFDGVIQLQHRLFFFEPHDDADLPSRRHLEYGSGLLDSEAGLDGQQDWRWHWNGDQL